MTIGKTKFDFGKADRKELLALTKTLMRINQIMNKSGYKIYIKKSVKPSSTT